MFGIRLCSAMRAPWTRRHLARAARRRLDAGELLEWRTLLAVTFQPELPLAATNSNSPNSMFSGDFDGDGDLDLVVASSADDRVAWYENLGATFGPQRLITDQAPSVAVVYAADLDRDGDLDVISGGADSYDSDVTWYPNDGQGQFGEARLISADVVRTGDVFAFDLDGDGDLDVLSAARGSFQTDSLVNSSVAWYENLDGAGTFGSQNLIADSAIGARTVVAGDLDGDGDADVVAGSYYDNSVWWYENSGGGNFSDGILLTETASYVTTVVLADLNADQLPDIVYSSRDDHTVAWFPNRGGGEFGPDQVITLDSAEPYGIQVGDFDADGLPDVVVADRLRDRVVWYRNLGSNAFDAPQIVNDDLNGAVAVVAADADQDGDLDLFASGRTDNKVVFHANDGSGEFTAELQLTELGFLGPQYIGSADVDGDGDEDVLAAAFTGDAISWFENLDSDGTFGPERRISDRVNGPEIVLLADLDQDGDGDAISASFFDDKLAWYENLDGDGNFGPQRLISGDAEGPEYLAVADIDGDDDLDLVSASRYDGKVAWYENIDGKGTFGFQTVIWVSAVFTTYVAVADLDGDGDLDVIANEYERTSSTISWFENVDGDGTFGDQNVITRDVELPTEVAIADFDGDNDLDLATNSGDDGRLLWFENENGDGDFDQGRLITDAMDVPYSLRAADFDGDDDVDLVAVDLVADVVLWFENENSRGAFGPGQEIARDVNGPTAVAVADLDRDGDIDVLVALAGEDEVTWYRNLSDPPPLAGDFNLDGVLDVADVDLLCGEILGDGLDPTFDLTGDGRVLFDDMHDLIVNQLKTDFGDTNLDGVFDSTDFVLVFQLGEYEDGIAGNSTWAEGDWDCDGEFSTSDLVLAFQGGGFETSAPGSWAGTELALIAARRADEPNRRAFVG